MVKKEHVLIQFQLLCVQCLKCLQWKKHMFCTVILNHFPFNFLCVGSCFRMLAVNLVKQSPLFHVFCLRLNMWLKSFLFFQVTWRRMFLSESMITVSTGMLPKEKCCSKSGSMWSFALCVCMQVV